MNMFASSFRAIEARYNETTPGFRITLMDDRMLADLREQWSTKDNTRPKHFDWDRINKNQVDHGAIPNFEHFGWGFYVGPQLCALASGFIWKARSPYKSVNIENAEG